MIFGLVYFFEWWKDVFLIVGVFFLYNLLCIFVIFVVLFDLWVIFLILVFIVYGLFFINLIMEFWILVLLFFLFKLVLSGSDDEEIWFWFLVFRFWFL